MVLGCATRKFHRLFKILRTDFSVDVERSQRGLRMAQVSGQSWGQPPRRVWVETGSADMRPPQLGRESRRCATVADASGDRPERLSNIGTKPARSAALNAGFTRISSIAEAIATAVDGSAGMGAPVRRPRRMRAAMAADIPGNSRS